MSDKCNQMFFDFDGVICDSNLLKAKNIYKAALQLVNEAEARRFTNYFTSKNSVPREIKTMDFFRDVKVADKILSLYKDLNKNLVEAKMMPGLIDFLTANAEKEFIILSGGSYNEIIAYITKHEIDGYFKTVLCGPKTKEDNLKTHRIKSPACFIGDSFHDYKVARKFSLRFIFMYGATQETSWKNAKFENAIVTKDFIGLKDAL